MSDEERAKFTRDFERRQQAVEKLRSLGTNVLPKIELEIRRVARAEGDNPEAAKSAGTRLALAMEVLGTNARPILPVLIQEYQAGRNIGPMITGIVSIGGTDAGLILVSGLTNSDPTVRSATMSGLSAFANNKEVALAAVPPLLERLEDNSAFSRAVAARILGAFQCEPDRVIPVLLKVAETDTDHVVRRSAIKALAEFGLSATGVVKALESLLDSETDQHTRRGLLSALEEIRGNGGN